MQSPGNTETSPGLPGEPQSLQWSRWCHSLHSPASTRSEKSLKGNHKLTFKLVASELYSIYNGLLHVIHILNCCQVFLWHLPDCRNPVYFGHSLFLRTVCLKTSTSRAQGLADSKHRLMFKSTMYIPSLSKS